MMVETESDQVLWSAIKGISVYVVYFKNPFTIDWVLLAPAAHLTLIVISL